MSVRELAPVPPFTAAQFEAAVGPLEEFAHQCHAASIALVKALGHGHRVARGFCGRVGGQHSWVVRGADCYDPHASIIDPTLWSYDSTVEGVWVGRASDIPHTPHGSGNIFDYGKPASGGGEPIELDYEFSAKAADFLAMLGPLDRTGWAQLLHAPVGLWPAAEIVGAAYDDARLTAIIPVDIVGMLTDRNPMGLYLP